jgi:branched-chain amino acid transport system permease protein
MRPCGVFDERYAQDIAIVRTWQHWLALIGGLVLLYTLPLYGSYYVLGLVNSLSILIIVILGLQIVMGYCGQISLGQPAFMAVGAYTSAILTTHYGMSFWIALPLSGIAAGIVGIIGGAPSLRIKGFYLAMATLAAHFVIMYIIMHLNITGGIQGIHPPPPKLGSIELDSDERIYYLIVTMMVICAYAARNLIRSKVGRAFVAINDNDLAAEVMGINLYYYKLLAFFISCVYAGLGGSLWAHYYMLVHPEQFTLMHAIWYVGMVIIGGMGSIPGVFFGVLFVRLIDEIVLFSAPTLSSVFPWLGPGPGAALGLSAFGLVLLLFIILEPRGIAHRWEVFKESYRLYPFAY